MTPREDNDLHELQTFVVQLGAAMNAANEPVHSVQERLTEVARAFGADAVTVSAFPTYLMVTMGTGEPAMLELTTVLGGAPRLDQIAALDTLVLDAMRGKVRPDEGLRRLAEIRRLPARFGWAQSILGYAVLTVGVCLILHPAPREVVAAAVFGVLVGTLRYFARGQPTLQILTPVIAAFTVSALSALAVRHDVTDPGLAAMVASLVIFLPGAALTTSVLELAAGQMVSGASRLVSGGVQLALLAFGILAGIEAVGIPASQVMSGSSDLLGPWSPWLGVLVFAVGVVVAYSAPRGSSLGFLVVLYAAWIGQVIGNAAFGAYVSALVGAAVMTIAAFVTARLVPAALPAHALSLPGFWLLVPGALGLIGLTQLAGGSGGEDLVSTVGSIFGVALGILCGTQLLAWAVASGRIVGELSDSIADRRRWLRRRWRDSNSASGGGHDESTPPE
jgi:uncharacterized membrane protein YjjP (DUF1212 family)